MEVNITQLLAIITVLLVENLMDLVIGGRFLERTSRRVSMRAPFVLLASERSERDTLRSVQSRIEIIVRTYVTFAL